MATSSDKITRRLNDSKANKEIKDAFYRIRRVVAGDYTSIGGDKVGVKYDNVDKLTRSNKNYPTFKTQIWEEGVGNHLYEWLKILVMQTVLQKPSIDFPSLKPEHSAAREAYLHDRLEKNFWELHQEKMIFHYLIDGIGWIKVGMIGDIPALRSVDTLDLFWDLHAEWPNETTFIGHELVLKIDVAKELLGDAFDRLGHFDKDGTEEDTVRVIEYWDRETLAYCKIDNFEVLTQEDSPYQGFIPFIAIHGPMLPSQLSPLPHIVSVIGAQTAHATLQRSITETARKMAPQIILNPVAFTPESFREFQDNPDDVSVLVLDRTYKDNADPYRIIQPGKITQDVLALKKDIENEIVRHMGVNPLAAGAPINPEFAIEVKEISARSGLNASFISEKLANGLQRIFRRLIKIGFLHDDAPFLAKLDGVPHRFEGPMPFTALLEEDVPCVVKPGSFETSQMKLVQNLQLLQQLNADPVMRNNRQLRRELWANVAFEAGFRDIETLLTIEEDDQMLQVLAQAGIKSPQELMQIIQQLQQPQQTG